MNNYEVITVNNVPKEAISNTSTSRTDSVTQSDKTSPENINSSVNQSQKLLEEQQQQILAKEDEIMKQLELKKKEWLENNDETEEDGSPSMFAMAFDLYMIIVKTYFAILLQFGDAVTTSIIQTFLPDEISRQIISGQFDMKTLIPTLKNSVQALKDEEFRTELGIFFAELKETVEPEITDLLKSIFKIFADVASKNSSKLMSIITASMSTFPPAALFFNVASLASVGVNSLTSGLKLADASVENLSKMQSKFPVLVDQYTKTKNILSEKGLDISSIVPVNNEKLTQNITKLSERVKGTLGNSFDKFRKVVNIPDEDKENLVENAKKFGESIQNSATSAAKGAVNLIHPTSITPENFTIKQDELKDLYKSPIENKTKIVQLEKDLDNYIKNIEIKRQITNEDNIINKGLNILETEGVKIDKDKLNSSAESVKKNVADVASSAFNFGKSMLKTASDIKIPQGQSQTQTKEQMGGSIKQFHNLSKKISSRILKSLNQFTNTDNIKTKKRKPHKYTKKNRKYRK
jgi:hypothetical protein